MMEQIKLFLFVLSIIYCSRFIFEFLFKLTQENPEPLVVKETEKIFLYFTISYIITYILI
jgi:hypothetical protein